MKLIYIYGPPAVGKLTVAKELEKITGYKIFHNHSTVDILTPYFEFGDDLFQVSKKIRLDIFEQAAKAKLSGLIFTVCYVDKYKGERPFVRKTIKRVEKHKGKVCFVKLEAKENTLMKRVKEPSRKKYGKLKSPKKLKESMKKWNYDNIIPFAKNLIINTDKHTTKQSAELIAKHYKLK